MSNQNNLFLKIDFAKAYDQIECPFILSMLQALGFGPNFIQFVEILFGDSNDCITIKNSQSKAFELF